MVKMALASITQASIWRIGTLCSRAASYTRFAKSSSLFLADMRSRADPPGTENCKDSVILLPAMCVNSQPG